MNLFNGTIRPGSVMEVLDDGVIKASAPGLFNFTDDPSKMPPIMPWQIGSNCNSFSKLKVHDDVWIMNFSDNPRQLYWFRRDRMSEQENMTQVLTETNVEILCNREVAGEWCSIYFSDGSGWIVSKGSSIIQIRPDGSILLNTDFPKRCIDISAKSISLGKEGGSSHPAVYGDEVANVFMSILSILRQIQIGTNLNPHTKIISDVLGATLPGLEKQIPNIISPHVTLE